MTQTTSRPIETKTLDGDGVTLTYDVRPSDGTTTEPPLLLIGSPMGASGFGTLASHFPDRTVVTYDPRGVERSVKARAGTRSTPEQHADDIHRVIEAVGGPVDLFANSGGAVNALALMASHPEDVRRLIAHEPPLASQLPDREAAMALTTAIGETYQQRGFGAGLAQFIVATSHKGEFPADFASQPAPDPAMFGMPTEDDGKRDDALLFQNIVSCTHYEPDYDAVRAALPKIVIAVGEESEGEMARRGGEAVAQRLGVTPVIFPSGHGGFLGNEYGQPGQPEAFAAKLREALAS